MASNMSWTRTRERIKAEHIAACCRKRELNLDPLEGWQFVRAIMFLAHHKHYVLPTDSPFSHRISSLTMDQCQLSRSTAKQDQNIACLFKVTIIAAVRDGMPISIHIRLGPAGCMKRYSWSTMQQKDVNLSGKACFGTACMTVCCRGAAQFLYWRPCSYIPLTDTTRCHVSCNHNRMSTCTELIQYPITFVLLLVAVNSQRRKTILSEETSNIIRRALCTGENNCLLFLLLHYALNVIDKSNKTRHCSVKISLRINLRRQLTCYAFHSLHRLPQSAWHFWMRWEKENQSLLEYSPWDKSPPNAARSLAR